MDLAFVLVSGFCPAFGALALQRIGGLRQFGKRGPNRRQRGHKAAGAQHLAARTGASGYIAFHLLLVHAVHVQQAVGNWSLEDDIFDVLAKHADAFLSAAPEQVGAVIVVVLRLYLLVVWHSSPPESMSRTVVMLWTPLLSVRSHLIVKCQSGRCRSNATVKLSTEHDRLI